MNGFYQSMAKHSKKSITKQLNNLESLRKHFQLEIGENETYESISEKINDLRDKVKKILDNIEEKKKKIKEKLGYEII